MRPTSPTSHSDSFWRLRVFEEVHGGGLGDGHHAGVAQVALDRDGVEALFDPADLAQVLELYGAKISHVVYLEARESHLMKGISPRNPGELRGYWEI